MNNVTPPKKAAIMKALAVLGFFCLIGLIAWASVQIVSYAPNAFTSLASIANSVDQYKEALSTNDEPLAIKSDIETANTGGPITISWGKDTRNGTYAFSYACADGVAVDIVDTDGLRSIACETRYDIGDTDALTIMVDSQKQRQTAVAYSISFIRANEASPIRTGERLITVTNTSIPESTDSTTAVLGEKDSTQWQDDIVTTNTVTTSASTPVTPKPTIKPTPKPIYTLPVSNSNGFTDLVTRFLNVGKISSDTFTAGTLHQNTSGAFQFEVHNLGTKTSAKWTYSVTLPDGDSYTSSLQAPLKPNERATIAIGFPIDDDTSHTFAVVVAETTDINFTNNTFKKNVTILR